MTARWTGKTRNLADQDHNIIINVVNTLMSISLLKSAADLDKFVLHVK